MGNLQFLGYLFYRLFRYQTVPDCIFLKFFTILSSTPFHVFRTPFNLIIALNLVSGKAGEVHLKQEEVYLFRLRNLFDVIEKIPYFIEDVYNKMRLHSSLGYRPKEEYERLLAENSSREYLVC